jgi:riboflavin biosynthesis pyrimidine reductase
VPDQPPFAPLERLFERDGGGGEARGAQIPPELERTYGGGLTIPLRDGRPTVIANFVSTIDGVVALTADGTTGGGEVSGFYKPDRFVMGMLRALSDVVLIGAGSVRAAPTHRWTPGHVHRPSAEAYGTWREREGIAAPEPTTMVVTRGGDLDPAHPGLADPRIPVIIVTTPEGAARVAAAGFGAHVTVVSDAGPNLPAVALRYASDELGARVVLCEGGPHLLGEFLEGRRIHELFLTLAPQLAGRAPGTDRLALVEGNAFDRDGAPWSDLVSVSRSDDYLFLRYHVKET